MSIQEINVLHYNAGYKSPNWVSLILHPIFSYDQQSKAKRNFREIKKHIALQNKKMTNIQFLDYGYGLGSLLLKMRKSKILEGIEISDVAQNNLKSICSILNIRMSLFNYLEGVSSPTAVNYDVISCSHVLEHLEEEVELLEVFHNRLTKDGILLLNLPINEIWEDPKHVRKYDRASVEMLLKNTGFYINKVVECDRLTAFILNKKLLNRSIIKNFVLKAISATLAILPVSSWNAIEKALPKSYMNQQLIVIASKRIF